MGTVWVWNYIVNSFPARTARIILVVVTLTFLGSTLPKTLSPVSQDKAYLREAGRYLHGRKGAQDLAVFVFDRRIAFYAQANPIFLGRRLPESELVTGLYASKGSYLAVNETQWRKHYPRVAHNPSSFGLVMEKRFKGSRDDTLMVFRIG